MVPVPRGEFFRGSDNSLRSDEKPRHLVKISSFYLDETLVTYSAFRSFVETTHYITTAEKKGVGMVAWEGLRNWAWEKIKGSFWANPFGPTFEFKMADDLPVVSVSWRDAFAYCAAQKKRLPTEAEWEYAMRAGSDKRFPWGNDPRRADGKMGLNFWQGKSHTNNTDGDGYLYMSPVKAFPPNAWGIYDPVGNVWQWVNDWYGDGYYREIKSAKGALDPQGPPTGKQKVARGGSWWCSSTTCEGFGLNYRGKAHPDAVFNNNGFRCAL